MIENKTKQDENAITKQENKIGRRQMKMRIKVNKNKNMQLNPKY